MRSVAAVIIVILQAAKARKPSPRLVEPSADGRIARSTSISVPRLIIVMDAFIPRWMDGRMDGGVDGRMGADGGR